MRLFSRGLDLAIVLALAVILLGAWVRLTDAGLGCPDWPGCYGHLTSLPATDAEIAQAIAQDPRGQYDAGAAGREMLHRFAAGALGLLVLGLTVIGFRRSRDRALRTGLGVLLALIVVQALLGMWTVTLRLQPLIVTLHLFGGFATLALLWWLRLHHRADYLPQGAPPVLRGVCAVALVALVIQIGLGGWTSTNYAALACPDFPTCRDAWWPEGMDFTEGFVLWRGADVDYEFGVLESGARTAIHVAHRIGAAVVTVLLLLLVVLSLRAPAPPVRQLSGVVLGLLALQVSLGIANVLLHLPLGVAVAHNGGAVLLLLAVMTQYRQLRPPS